jgi:hypothetical protein
MEDEALFLLKHPDVDLVEMVITAMGPDVDLSIETERLAATFFLAARSPDRNVPNPTGGWRADLIQPFCIEKVVVVPVKGQAKRVRPRFSGIPNTAATTSLPWYSHAMRQEHERQPPHEGELDIGETDEGISTASPKTQRTIISTNTTSTSWNRAMSAELFLRQNLR